jgi:putative tryptophan/tyrosine transport system substrate-binding protein
MRRRTFISLLGGAASWPLAARAQRPPKPVIGWLGSETPDMWRGRLRAFHQGLGEAGYVVGSNVEIEYRWAEGHYDRLPAIAAELVSRQVDVIAVGGGNIAALAAKGLGTTIPMVFAIGGDPVALGLVENMNRPGGNITGISFLVNALEAKRAGLLLQLVPQTNAITALVNPNQPTAEVQLEELDDAAHTIGREIVVEKATSEQEIHAVFAKLTRQIAPALLVTADAFFVSRREQIVALAAHHALPAIYPEREFAEAGGLMSYGTALAEAYRAFGTYTGRILMGTRPGDLPVIQATKFEVVINLKTAKALGIAVSPTLLAIADEVIE